MVPGQIRQEQECTQHIMVFQVDNVHFRELSSVPHNLSPGQLSWHPDSAHIVGVAWSNHPWVSLYPESANRDTALFVVNAETNK